MKQGLATEDSLSFSPIPRCHGDTYPGGVIVYWKKLEKFLPRHGKPSAKILWLSVLRQRSRTIWSTTMDVIEQSSKTFLPLVAIDIVGDHRNVGILYGCIDEAGK